MTDNTGNSKLKAALDPVAHAEADVYEGKKSVYITFNYDTIPGNFGDDEPEHERVLIQVHLYAPTGLNVLGKIRAIKGFIGGGYDMAGLCQRVGQGRAAPYF